MKKFSQFLFFGGLIVLCCVSVHAQNGNTLSGEGTGALFTDFAFENTHIGDQAGANITGGDRNVIFGYEAGFSADLADSVLIGYRAGYSINFVDSTFNDNAFVGFEAGWRTTTGKDNTFFGSEAGESNTTGFQNVFFGEEAGERNTTGSDNVLIGVDALAFNTTGTRYIVIGNSSGGSEDAGYASIYIGDDAVRGGSGQNDSNNVYVGSQSGYLANGGVANVAVGAFSGANNDFADFNVYAGAFAGYGTNRSNSTTLSNRNTFVGMAAGYTNRDGEDNVVIGAFAGFDDLSAVSNDVTIFQDAGGFDHSDRDVGITNKDNSRQTVVGSLANTRADDAIAIGYFASSQAASAIALGNQSLVADTHDNAIVIGNGASSQGANIMVLGNDTLTGIIPGSDGAIALGGSDKRFSVATAEAFAAQADTDADVQIEWMANNGLNNADRWQLKGNDGGSLDLQTFAAGSFTNALTLSHSGELTIAGDLTINSDRELKHNISNIENALSKVMALEGRSYEWRPESGRSSGAQFGFVAQEVEAVLPELVSTHNASGVKSVNYQAVLPILVNAVNEQQIQMEGHVQSVQKSDHANELATRLAQQSDNIESLQAELAQQQAMLEIWQQSLNLSEVNSSSTTMGSTQ